MDLKSVLFFLSESRLKISVLIDFRIMKDNQIKNKKENITYKEEE